MKRKNLGRAVLVLFLLLPALAVWWPLWFMGTGALMPLDELRAALGPVLQGAEGSAFWPLLPSWPTLQPLAELLLDTPQFFTMFWNTCAIVFPQVLGQVLVGAPAAWAFSRLRFRGRRALFTLYIVLMLMPFQVTMVSGYLVADAMGIMDTFWAIILPGVFSTFPVFIMGSMPCPSRCWRPRPSTVRGRCALFSISACRWVCRASFRRRYWAFSKRGTPLNSL